MAASGIRKKTIQETAKGIVDSLDDKQTILTIAYMCSLNGKRVANTEATINALDKLCGNGKKLWTVDPDEYVRKLRNNDRI